MYYPKSQIKSNLYTNGDEYILSTTQEGYIGYYYEVSNGQRYTGKYPQDGPNILLIKSLASSFLTSDSNISSPPIILDNIEIGYNINNQERYLPQFNLTLPTSQDQQNGQFTRYFCKRNNESKYIEISKTTFNQLYTKSQEIAWDLYTPISILWQIKGHKILHFIQKLSINCDNFVKLL